MYLRFTTRPDWINSRVYATKDSEFNNQKTYGINLDDYLVRRVISFKGQYKVPQDIFDSCLKEYKEREYGIELWSKRRFFKFDKLQVSKDLILDDYQVKALDLMNILPRVILNMDMGTGKTATIIGWWGQYFYNKSMLIVCPNNVKQEWVDQFQKFLGITPKIISHNSEYSISNTNGIGNVYIINYEKFRKEPKAFKTEILVFDEVHKGASLTSSTHKAMFNFSLLAERVYGLSGSIVGNHFEDILGIFAVVDPAVYGTNKEVFYKTYTNYLRGENKEWIILSYKNWDAFNKNFHSISYTIKLEDVIDMPEKREEFIYCKKDANYKKLMQEYIFTAEGIDLETGTKDLRLFTVDRALNMTAKLMQLCSGFIKDTDGNWIRLNTLKRDSLDEWFINNYEYFKTRKEKIVIFYQFSLSGDDIEYVLKNHNIIYKRIDGSVSDKNKELYKKQFKDCEYGDSSGCDVIVINYGTGTEGMNFQRGTCMMYYDQTLEFRKKEQAERRIYRRGQTNNCLYINFVAEKSKEVDTYRKLAKIKDFSEFLNVVKTL